jgi:hypothetical protein
MDIKETLIDQLKKIVQFLNKQKIDYALAGELAFIHNDKNYCAK